MELDILHTQHPCLQNPTTVDGNQKSGKLTSWGWVVYPIIGFFISKRWCRISAINSIYYISKLWNERTNAVQVTKNSSQTAPDIKDKKLFARVGHAFDGLMDGKTTTSNWVTMLSIPIHSWFGVNTFELTSAWNMVFVQSKWTCNKKGLDSWILAENWLNILKLIKQIPWFWSMMILLRHPLITHNLWNDSLSAPTPQYESNLWMTKGIDKKALLDLWRTVNFQIFDIML